MEQMNATPDSLRDRELDVVREVAHAFLTATTAIEVYRVALARVTPLVGAKFSSVFLRDPADASLLKLACAVNWPQSAARYLDQLRLRVGRGPTGRAVVGMEPVEIEDVFANPALHHWHDPARELGFVSLISLPLVNDGAATGALTFYFDESHVFDGDERHLMMLVADQLALATGRIASLYAERRELERLREENRRLRERIGEGESAARMKDEFLSNISHELRTPLTSILGYANLMVDGHMGSLDEKQRTAVVRLEESARRLLRLISDLLELSQIKLGNAALDIATDDAVLVARRALDDAGPAPTGVDVRLESAAERIPVTTDVGKVARILGHVLDNAYKFTAAGSVTMRVQCGSDEGVPNVEWVVTDTGIGIPQDCLDRIFDEFRQLDGTSTRAHGGAGLGLALCRALAQLLGGSITVKSEPGRGSAFRVVVPSV